MKKIIIFFLTFILSITCISQSLLDSCSITPYFNCLDNIKVIIKGPIVDSLESEPAQKKLDSLQLLASCEYNTKRIFNFRNCFEQELYNNKNNIIITFYDSTKNVNEIIEVKKCLNKDKYVKEGVYIKLSKEGYLEVLGEYKNDKVKGKWYWFSNAKVVSLRNYTRKNINNLSIRKRCGCTIR